MTGKSFLLVMTMYALFWSSISFAAEVPVIAAASDLSHVLTSVTDQFTRETGQKIRLSFGSSGNLKRLVEQGRARSSAKPGYVGADRKQPGVWGKCQPGHVICGFRFDPGLKVRVQQEKPVPLNSETYSAPGELIVLIGPSGGGGDLTVVGENTVISMLVNGQRERRLSLTVSSHVAERNYLSVGADISVSLLQQGLHLMPLQEREPTS